MGLTVIFFRIIVFRMFFMSRTTLIWKAVCCKVFCYTWTTGICQISANCADGFLLYRTWHYKIFCFKILMYSAHDSFPDAETEFCIGITFFVIIITAPYSTCVISVSYTHLVRHLQIMKFWKQKGMVILEHKR